MNKKIITYSIITLIIILSVSAVAIADITLPSVALLEKWYDKKLPSSDLAIIEKEKLILEDKTLWYSNSYWKDGNCYYFDLHIGNTTNITWTDPRRELTCTQKTLSGSEIEAIQIENVRGTLKELGKIEIPQLPAVRTSAKKGENFKEGTLITE